MRSAAWWATAPPNWWASSAPLPYWPADQADELDLVHRDIIAQGTRDEGVEVQFQHRDGHLVDVLIHEAPLTTAAGRADRLDEFGARHQRAQARPAPGRACSKKRLEASGRLVAVGEVASTLAHELNQPLGALSSFANGLLNRLRERSIALRRSGARWCSAWPVCRTRPEASSSA